MEKSIVQQLPYSEKLKEVGHSEATLQKVEAAIAHWGVPHHSEEPEQIS